MSTPCESDRASIAEQNFINSSLLLSKKKEIGAVATGQCLWCDADVPHDHRWCDGECRDEWQAEQNRLKKLGKH